MLCLLKQRIGAYGSRDFVLSSSVLHGLAGNFDSIILGILGLHSQCKTLALAGKQRIMIVSTEFSGKQSHEIGLRSGPNFIVLLKHKK